MTEVAATLGSTPAAVTYHCGHLEAAGLITRQRRGRQVRLTHTPRGQAILDLYA